MDQKNFPKILSPKAKKEILKKEKEFCSLFLNEEQKRDAKNIARGIYFPLDGFLKEGDFLEVLEKMRLLEGSLWPIPIVLDISKKQAQKIKKEKEILLKGKNGKIFAILKEIEVFSFDKNFFAQNLFGTRSKKHPGVKEIYQMKDYLLGGKVFLFENKKTIFPQYNFFPQETKKYFKEKNWKTICAFQTRNVPHRAHEFLQKEALKIVDGLFLQPLIGKKKKEDFKDEYILACWEAFLERYLPKERVLFGILPLKMFYAGPREALFHALIRRNFGCTHFIVGRDHAGVGKFYSPSASQEIFEKFEKKELGIEILKFPEVVFCQECQRHIFINRCSHSEKQKIRFSGTKLRKMIKAKEKPPFYLIRPEVYYLLSQGSNSLIDEFYQKERKKKGFCLWLTGLSQSGKTTIANFLSKILKERGFKVERLDGDVVRESLGKDLGFTKKERDENIKRVGTLASLFVQKGIVVIASFISPYKAQRKELRKRIPNFIEIFVNCPLEICEKRDKKGLYQKAREGKIKNFTGISHPYQIPEKPEIEIKTHLESIEKSTQKIIQYLEKNKLI